MPKRRPPPKVDPRWKKVGALITEDREKIGLGQAELGRKLGLQTAGTSMWRYEAGRSGIPITRLEQIAELLGQPVERYMLSPRAKERPPLTPEERRELHQRMLKKAMDAMIDGTDEAYEKFNAWLADNYVRTGR